jgi:hypothetical protein
LKLPQLLSQFLYQSRKLDLPGIGSFTLDPAAVIPGESDRAAQTPASGISFKNTIVASPDDELIRFIQVHTGKMKPLAAADLDFFLTSGKQMLNIGKHFHLEGIGTLLKNKEGYLDFTPGEYSTAKLEEPGPGNKERTEKRKPASEEPRPGYEHRSNAMRQILLLVGIIGGLIIICWGGYSLYKRNILPEPAEPRQAATPPHDTAAARPDSAAGTRMNAPNGAGVTAPNPNPANPPAAAPPPPATIPPIAGQSLYKFIILETTHKGRALRRYNQLLGFQLNIKMEQRDSSHFKLYFPIAANIRDTIHIKDSLADVYAAHVTIER